MPGHSRSKNGVASLAYGAGHPRLPSRHQSNSWMAGTSPAMTWRESARAKKQKAGTGPALILKRGVRLLAAVLAAQPHHHVDARDLVALGRRRHLADDLLGVRDVHQRVVALHEEVVMRGGVGVEIGLRAVDRDLAQQADLGELMQRVVDGGERD